MAETSTDIHERVGPSDEVMRRVLSQETLERTVIYQVPYSGDETPIEVVKPQVDQDWLNRPA